ncbi:MAG: hypothetical protein WAS73_00130 [Defluviicoccus sp.]
MLFVLAVLVSLAVVLPPATASAAQPPLTEKSVLSVISANRDLAPVFAKHEAAMRAYAESPKGREAMEKAGDDPCTFADEQRAVPGFAEMEKAVRTHGFADGEAYCRQSFRVFATCAAIDAQRENPDWRKQMGTPQERTARARDEMERMLKEIESNPKMTPQQKSDIRKQLTETMRDVEKSTSGALWKAIDAVSDEDMRVAAPHCTALEESVQRITPGQAAPPAAR